MSGSSRVVMASATGRVEVGHAEIPAILPQDMLGKVEISGICGTDVHMLFDETPGKKFPFSLGHEVISTIVEMGSEAPRHDSNGIPLAVGDRIAAYWPSCGECYYCRVLNQPFLCIGKGIGRLKRQRPAIGGGYADYVYVSGDAILTRVPDSVPTKVAALTEPLAGATRAIERAYLPGIPDREQAFGPGKTVVVQGSGPIGALIAAVAKLSGAYKVIVIGAPDNRLELCKRLGADVTINFMDTTEEERLDMICGMTPFGIGPDVVVEAAGALPAFVEAINLVRKGGIVIEHGHFTPRGTVPFDPSPIVLKDIQLLGNKGYYSFNTAMRILEANWESVPFEKMVTHEFGLSDAQEALDTAHRQECMKAVLIPSIG